MYRLMIILMAIVVSLGCGGGDSGSQPARVGKDSLTIKGSDTMVHLVTTWAEAYGKDRRDVEISVTGGGSGTGVSALLNRTTDICAASRDMTAEEKQKAEQKGLRLVERAVARDGIAVIVHPSNPVNELTIEQLRKIYIGASANWRDVGGADGGFVILSRETSSGTYVFFQEHVLNKQDYTPKARLMPATSAIIQSVSEDALAIGYVGLGYALEAKGKVKVLRIKAKDDAPSVEPSEDTVRSGAYSISRPLYFYMDDAASASAKAFVEFCLSERGQAIVREVGFVPVG